MSRPHLSKSRYLAGLQCDRRLWLEVHSPEQATPLAEAQLQLFRMGSEVGRAAHLLFPGGVLIDAGAANHTAAVRQTLSLMSNDAVPAIFEAAFEHEGVRIRVDVLERRRTRPGGECWGLREVKSSSRVKRAQHLPDLTIQKWVLDGNGLEIDSVELIHVNADFVRGSEEIDWPAYFSRVELMDEVTNLGRPDVAKRVAAMHETLTSSSAPEREPAAFCKKPHLCSYWASCTSRKSASWFIQQTGARAASKARMIEVAQSGRPWFSDALSIAIAGAAPPVWALDFETIGPAIPFFEGTKPFQAIAFQWSLHRLGSDGELDHFEYLASGREDPRAGLAQALVEALGRDEAPVLAYSGYEKRCLKALAEHSPELAEELHAIVDRLVDLLPIVQANVYHPDFQGSFSIKKVGPALAPHVRYDDLSGVADGMAALGAFAAIIKGELTGADEARIRAELLAYCQRDTLALLEVYRALNSAVS
jgi:hypothetical protein